MHWSKYNLISPVGRALAEEYAILNPLSGNFDFFTGEEKPVIDRIRDGLLGIGADGQAAGDDPKTAITEIPEADKQMVEYLLERGYLFRTRSEEERLLRRKRGEFQATMEETPVQLLLVPTYSCNLACTYCFQDGIRGKDQVITREVTDAFFRHIDDDHSDRPVKPFITLFGGEPLRNSPVQREAISYIAEQAARRGYPLSAVTNGYDLVDYVEILKRAVIKEIQVTVDGPREVHDSRRHTANRRGTFDRIMTGIEAAIQAGFPINLRVVADRENIGALADLARILEDRGWLDLGPARFKTQIGRNYELFDCYSRPDTLLSEIELWRAVAEAAQNEPILRKFHRPEFRGMGHLADTGELYLPSFDTCPAYKTEWVYDLHGNIYGCTASCGREEYRGGTFYPEVRLDRDEIGQWEKRDILSIPECRDCSVSLMCGGGCGVVARNRLGKVLAPDCRPVKELVELGIDYYYESLAGRTEAS